MRCRHMITRAAIVAVAALLTAGWPGTPSAAADAQGWVSTPDGLPLFDLAAIAPGDSGAATLIITNPQSFDVTFTLSVASLRNDDHGCTEPERAAGDSTCGVGGGELQDDLRITLTDATGALLAADTLQTLAGLTVLDPTALHGNETRAYDVGYELPIWSTNITQSDRVAFEFELTLEQVDGDDVDSEALPATPGLPATGGDQRVVVVVALALVAVGVGLWSVGSRRLGLRADGEPST